MNLLTMPDYETVNSYANYYTQVYHGVYISFLLNAYKASVNSSWVEYSDLTTPIYSGLNWKFTVNIYPAFGSFVINSDLTYNGRAVPGGINNVVCEFI